MNALNGHGWALRDEFSEYRYQKIHYPYRYICGNPQGLWKFREILRRVFGRSLGAQPMCSGCSGNYEDSDCPEPEDAATEFAAAGRESDGSGETGAESQCEVLVSADRIVEVRTTPANLWTESKLGFLADGVAWDESRAVRKHSTYKSAKHYQAKQRSGFLHESQLGCLAKPRVVMWVAVISAGLMAAWLLFG
jgi:hypothetical protein